MSLTEQQKTDATNHLISALDDMDGVSSGADEAASFLTKMETYKAPGSDTPENKKDEWLEMYYNEHIGP